MIIPAKRLLLAFSLTVLPASLAPLFTGYGMELFAGALLLLSMIAAVDAVASLAVLKGIAIDFPARLNMARRREAFLHVRLSHGKGRPLSLALALEIPPALSSPWTTVPVVLPEKGGDMSVSWPLTGLERGVHLIGRCRVRTTSPLGLWLAQSALDAGVGVHVYPPLHEERKKLAALFTRRNDMLLRPQRQIGRGREFEKLRNYLPGDSLGDIHWKATARRGHPVTKEFRIERTQEVYCVIDASRLSARRDADRGGVAGDSFLDACISASLLLAGIAIRQGDLFGVMTFSDQPISFIRAAGGMGHFGVCREALYQTQPSLVTPDFAETASFLASRLRRRALLLFLTSLDEPVLADAFSRSIQVLAGRHLALVHSVSPAAAHPLFSDSGADDADDLYDRLGGHLVWHGLRRTVETLRLRGVEMALTDRERFCASLAARYLNVKRRQIL